MTTSRTPALLAAAAVSAVIAAGCGGDEGDPIPNRKAAALQGQLDRAHERVEAGRCDAALSTIDEARSTVDTLDDDGVGSDVQDALGDGVDNLRTLAIGECDVVEEPVETTPETTPETLPPPTTETTPPPTETTPPPTETAPPPVEEPDEGDGGAQFDPDAEVPPGQQKKLEDDG